MNTCADAGVRAELLDGKAQASEASRVLSATPVMQVALT